jgi:hypothetical protein
MDVTAKSLLPTHFAQIIAAATIVIVALLRHVDIEREVSVDREVFALTNRLFLSYLSKLLKKRERDCKKLMPPDVTKEALLSDILLSLCYQYFV